MYLHILSFVKKKFPLFPHLLPKNHFILQPDPLEKKHGSVVYTVIQGIKQTSWHKTAWEKDLGVELPEEALQDSLTLIHTTWLRLLHWLIQFKVLNRGTSLPESFPT